MMMVDTKYGGAHKELLKKIIYKCIFMLQLPDAIISKHNSKQQRLKLYIN